MSDKSLKVDSKRSSRLKVDCDKSPRTSLTKKESVVGKGSEVKVVEEMERDVDGVLDGEMKGGVGGIDGGVDEGVEEVFEEVVSVVDQDGLVAGAVEEGIEKVMDEMVESGVEKVIEGGTEGLVRQEVLEQKVGLSITPKSQGDVAVAGKRGSRETVSRERLSRDSESCLEEGADDLYKLKEPDVDAVSEISQAETLPYEKLDDEEEEEVEDDDSSHPYTIGDDDDNDRVPAGGDDDDDEVDDEIQSTLCPGKEKVKVEKVVGDDDDEYRRLGDESMSSIPDLSNIGLLKFTIYFISNIY